LRPYKAAGYYDLIAAKRGKRLAWKDAEGNPTLVKPIAHSNGIMFWREVPPDELAEVEKGVSQISDEKRRRVVQIVEDHGKPFSSEKELVEAIRQSMRLGPTKARSIIGQCVERGELVKKPQPGTKAVAIYTAIQWTDATCPDYLRDVQKDGEYGEDAEDYEDYEDFDPSLDPFA